MGFGVRKINSQGRGVNTIDGLLKIPPPMIRLGSGNKKREIIRLAPS